MRSKRCCSSVILVAAVVSASGLRAQPAGAHVISVEPGPAVVARRGTEVDIPLRVAIRGGYHINSDKPAEDYLIPTNLTWTPGPLALRKVAYPKAESVTYEFSEKPLLVFSGAIALVSRFAVSPEAPRGPATLAGKLRYQACNDKLCLPPKTLDVSVPLKVE
jgi:hypothetical protein